MARVPPPPYLTKTPDNQILNRWLLELTAILNGEGSTTFDSTVTVPTEPPGTNTGQIASTAFVIANSASAPSVSVPLPDATPGHVGTATTYARGDHVHPIEASPTFTGTVTANGALLSNGATSGVGYATGAGGTVLQATNKSTGVTLNKASGAITMSNAALGGGAVAAFVLTDSAIAATDVLVLNHISGGSVGSYGLNAQCGAGSATINVRNNTGGSLSEAIVIQFALIKGVDT